jgi:hypothetical protein
MSTQTTKELSGGVFFFAIAGGSTLSAAIVAAVAFFVMPALKPAPAPAAAQTQSPPPETYVTKQEFNDFQVQAAQKIQANETQFSKQIGNLQAAIAPLQTALKTVQDKELNLSEDTKARLNQAEYKLNIFQEALGKLVQLEKERQTQGNQPTPTAAVPHDDKTDTNRPYVIIDQTSSQ